MTSQDSSPPNPLGEMVATFPMLERWRDLLAAGVRPAEGSELADDDGFWRYAPASTLATLNLAVAREHLHAVRLLTDARELFPGAMSTLARPALIGGAMAVWMLLSDDPEVRRRRSLSMVLDDYSEHIKFARQVLESFDPRDITSSAEGQLSRLQGRKRQVQDLLEPLGGEISINMNDDVIPKAVAEVWPSTRARAQVVSRWRAMSGASHALMWHYFGNAGTTVGETDPAGIGHITVAGDPERLLIDYFTGYHLTYHGWQLFARRAGRPDLNPDAD